MRYFCLFYFCLFSIFLFSQIPHQHINNRVIQFPDVPGYKTLTCDFHIHTVFSDGHVWPSIRVQEALRDSLDAIALTEHLEYQPKSEDIPHSDRNRSFEVAKQHAKAHNLIVINGSEITRNMPPGHNNAIFIKDANKLLIKDSIEVFREANRQGAFVFWNHPNWISQTNDGIAKLTDVHRYLIAEGLLHGIEVVNEYTYSDEALQIALDNNLTIIGTSDIHGLIDWDYKVHEGGHRPVTLVFAEERSVEAINKGLQERRTVVWFNNLLIGREKWLVPLIESCISVEKVQYMGAASVLQVFLKNNSDVEFLLTNNSGYTMHDGVGVIQVFPNTTTKIELKTREQLDRVDLKFQVLNAVTAPNINPVIGLKVEINK